MPLYGADCPKCGHHVEKEAKMMPRFVSYKGECPSCGTIVPLKMTRSKVT